MSEDAFDMYSIVQYSSTRCYRIIAHVAFRNYPLIEIRIEFY